MLRVQRCLHAGHRAVNKFDPLFKPSKNYNLLENGFSVWDCPNFSLHPQLLVFWFPFKIPHHASYTQFQCPYSSNSSLKTIIPLWFSFFLKLEYLPSIFSIPNIVLPIQISVLLPITELELDCKVLFWLVQWKTFRGQVSQT